MTTLTPVVQLPSPAKINRFLHVIGKRADGYHELETQFQFLEFADQLSFKSSPNIIRIDQHGFALPEEDLTIRAAKLLQSTCPQAAERGVTITLEKMIPPGSGLGGGSSNAATTLIALNHLWQLGLTRAQLAQLGLQLGADVPLFVHGRAAFASGVGEVLRPSDAEEQWLCVCIPPVEVSTTKVFNHPQLAQHLDNLQASNNPSRKTEDSTTNDLEAITTSLYPQVGDALKRMRCYTDARMSGSGSAVFAGYSSRKKAEQLSAQLTADFKNLELGLPTIVVTRSINRHLILDAAIGQLQG